MEDFFIAYTTKAVLCLVDFESFNSLEAAILDGGVDKKFCSEGLTDKTVQFGGKQQ